MGLLGGFNPYGYVGIPTTFVDPLGLEPSKEFYQNYRNARAGGMSPQEAYSAAQAGTVKSPITPTINKGPWGERVAAQYLGKQGHQVLGSVQNASGHGFDLVTRTKDGSIHVIEVKTSCSYWRGKPNMSSWVRDNISKITGNTNKRWGNMPQYQQDLMEIIIRISCK